MPRSKGRSGRPWQRLRQQVLAEEPLCRRCGQWIRHDVPWRHPLAATVDHIVPLIEGGHPTDRANLCAMHRSCNQTKEHERRRLGRVNSSRSW